jgi:hypothetical protein
LDRATSWAWPQELGINVFAIWVGIPDAATLPSALFIGVWLAGASVGLTRLSSFAREQVALQPA